MMTPTPLRTPYDGMTTPLIRGLINQLASASGSYVEVGSYRGATLTAAAHGNDAECVGVDNFSNFNRSGKNKELLLKAIAPYPNARLVEGDYKVAVPRLAKAGHRADVYYYDGPHTEEDTYRGLTLGLEMLEAKTFVVDDTNWSAVLAPTLRFADEVGLSVVFERFTDRRDDPDWWNGFMVLERR